MGKESKFVFKNPPAKPKRTSQTFSGSNNRYEDKLVSRLKMIAEKTSKMPGFEYADLDWIIKNLDKVTVSTWSVFIRLPEGKESFDAKMTLYQQELEDYSTWLKQNAIQIQQYEDDKKKQAAKAAEAKMLREKRQTEEARKRLERQLEETKKKLNKLAASSTNDM